MDDVQPGNNETLIVGTGALGALFAARLSAAGYRITMLGSWEPGLRALHEKGVRLVDARGKELAYSVRVARDADECRGVQQALVLVKAWQTGHAAEQLARCLSPEGLALTLQNGIGNYETLQTQLGAERVALGTTTTGATLMEPGLVKAAGEGAVSIQSHARIGPIEKELAAGGFKVNVVTDVTALVWNKLVINSAINPLTALLRVPNGELLKRPAARALMRGLAEETAAVARATQIEVTPDPAALAEQVAHQTAGNYSSMLQDVLRGAPTEIDAICGAVVRAAQQNGIRAPLNEACWRLVEALAQGSQGKVDTAMETLLSLTEGGKQ